MSFAFGIQALHPTASANDPHIFGFATARSVSGDTLLEVWNGSTDAAKKFAVDLDGNLATVNGATFSGNATVGGTFGVTGAATLSSTLAVTGDVTVGGASAAATLTLDPVGGDAWTITGSNSTALFSIASAGFGTVFQAQHTTGAVTIPGALAVTGAATFSASATFANNQAVQGKDSGGTARNMVKVGTGNNLLIGDGNLGAAFLYGGPWGFGTEVTTGASAGDVVLANAKSLRGVDGAGTGTRTMVRLDSSSQIQIAPDGGAVGIGNPANMTASAGELVLANARALRGVNAAGTSTGALIARDANDGVSLGGATPTAATGNFPRMVHYNTLLPLGNDPTYNGLFYLTNDGTNYYINAHMNGARVRAALTAF